MNHAGQAVVLFDAECGLCTRAVEFVRRRALHNRFRFVPLASIEAQALLADGPPPDQLVWAGARMLSRLAMPAPRQAMNRNTKA